MLRGAPPLAAWCAADPGSIGGGSRLCGAASRDAARVRDMETGYFGVGWAFASEASAGLKGSFGGALANIGSG